MRLLGAFLMAGLMVAAELPKSTSIPSDVDKAKIQFWKLAYMVMDANLKLESLVKARGEAMESLKKACGGEITQEMECATPKKEDAKK